MTSTAREQIASLLGTIGAGSFAARRTATADDLELAVKGVGPIRLPIPREQAQRLLSMSRPARYGQREQTLLDWRVRDTGEIPARRVKINRRRWNRTLQPMLAALGTDLGLAPEQRLSAELHSLLIYGPGQFFKRHQDSERADGMVGTLVVTLPSTFTGGAIVVEHQGEAVAYRATKQPLSFIAFYAAALAQLPVVDRVMLFGSVARPLRREVPRFAKFRRAGIELLHECKDVDSAVWVSDTHDLDNLRKAVSRSVNVLFDEQNIGVAHHQVDVFLLEPGSGRYLGRLCHFGTCPKGKPECEVPGCGARPFLRQHDGFVFDLRSLAPSRSIVLFDRAKGSGPPQPACRGDEIPF